MSNEAIDLLAKLNAFRQNTRVEPGDRMMVGQLWEQLASAIESGDSGKIQAAMDEANKVVADWGIPLDAAKEKP